MPHACLGTPASASQLSVCLRRLPAFGGSHAGARLRRALAARTLSHCSHASSQTALAASRRQPPPMALLTLPRLSPRPPQACCRSSRPPRRATSRSPRRRRAPPSPSSRSTALAAGRSSTTRPARATPSLPRSSISASLPYPTLADTAAARAGVHLHHRMSARLLPAELAMTMPRGRMRPYTPREAAAEGES
jgi:hypothetical protein